MRYRGRVELWVTLAATLVVGAVFVANDSAAPPAGAEANALAQTRAAAAPAGAPPTTVDAAAEALAGGTDGDQPVPGAEPPSDLPFTDSFMPWNAPLPEVPEQRGWVSLLAEASSADPVSVAGGVADSDSAPVSVTPVYWSVGRVSLLDANGAVVAGSDGEDVSPVTVELLTDEGMSVSAAASPEVVLNVVDSDSAAAAGFQKVAFTVRVDGVGGVSTVDDLSSAESAALQSGIDVRLTVAYGDFADEYGANWAGRLRLVSFEPCALTPGTPDCPGAQPVEGFVNDVANQELSVTVPLSELVGAKEGQSADSRSGTESGFAMLAGSGSSSGEYATTSLNPAGSWSVGTQSGGFSWSYPIAAGAPPAGSAPSFSVSYASGAIDGLTSDQNTQGGVFGPGWSLSEGFIERRYKGCGNDGGAGADFCWYTDNATFSFGGINGKLIRVATEPVVDGWRPTVFRLESHSGWKVRRFEYTLTIDDGRGGKGALGIDNDREYWVATAPDGTQYWFGYGKEVLGDGFPSTTLQSVQTAPVVGNHSGEPCNTLSYNWCHQAYRWSLDRIEDPNGRVTTLHYLQEVNYYGIRDTPGWSEPYVSAAVVLRAEYGQLASNAHWADWYTHAVTFTYQYRCDDPPAGGTCTTAPTVSNGGSFPDIPVDQICPDSYCENDAPTFFTRRMVSSIAAKVRDTSDALVNISQDIFTYNWVDPDGTAANSDPPRLWLRTIQHRGLAAGGSKYMPAIRFYESPAMGNRVDYNVAGGVTQMLYYRIGAIIDEYGAQTNVAYTRTKVCPADIGDGTPPAGWGGWTDNTWSCFVRWWVPPDAPSCDPSCWSTWHKWSVDSVTVVDQSGDQAATTRIFDYQYPQASSTSGGMAWHSDDNPFVPVGHRHWAEFRGFEWVRVIVGHTVETNRVLTDYTFHRGMSGDINSHNTGAPPGATVTTPSTLGAVTDADQLAGLEREVIVRDVDSNGNAGTAVFSATVTDYTSWSTDAGYGTSWQIETLRTRSRASYNAVVNWARVEYTYDNHAWMHRLVEVHDLGRVDGTTTAYANVTGDDGNWDELCQNIEYTPSGDRFVTGLVWRTRSFGWWDCSTGQLSDVRTYYDNSTTPTGNAAPGPTTAPTAGNLTAVWQAAGGGVTDEACECAPTGIVERTVFGNNGYHATAPSWGRVSSTVDARGYSTNFTYTPFSSTVPAFGARVITTTNALAHVVETEFDLYGRTVRTTDPNNRNTRVCHDALGRVTGVFLPNVSFSSGCAGTPSLTYVYDFDWVDANQTTPGGVQVPRWTIQARELFTLSTDVSNPINGVDTYLESWALFDGFGRIAQTNTPSPAGGRVVVRTRYDSQDNPVRVSQPFRTTAAPGAAWTILADNQIDRETLTTFDPVGRPLTVEQLDNNVSIYTSTMSYSPASTTTGVQRASGGADVYGRTVSYLDADGNAWRVTEEQNAGVNAETDYRYDQAGRLLSITDHAGNVTTMTYNQLGWRTSLDDPDAGFSDTNYYPTGQTRYTIDAKNQVLYTRIDALGRPIAVHASLTYTNANKLFAYNWDGGWNGLANAIGLITTTDAYTSAGAPNVASRSTITGLDGLGRPTSVEYLVPGGNGPSTGDEELGEPHTVTTRYTRNGAVYQQVYPTVAGSGLGTEVVTADFNAQGMPIQLAGTGTNVYTDLIEYDTIGRPVNTILGTNGAASGLDINTAYNASDGRLFLQNVTTAAATPTFIQRDTYTYDAAGNPTAIQHDTNGSFNPGGTIDETECFNYDSRQRLSRARTIDGLATCASQPAGGPAAFDNSYTINNIHNVTTFDGYTRTYNATIPTTSCNAGTDADKPHAINTSTLGTNSTDFNYDCNGAITTQTITGSNPGTTTYTWDVLQRLKTVANTAGTTTNTYDTTNNRVLRVDPDGTRTIYIPGTEIRWRATTGIDVARTYGQTRREFDGTLTHYATNHQGSITATNNPGGQDIIRYEPYGTTRNTFPGGSTNLDDRNFLGQPDDPATATVYLNNRHYLPAYGTFASVDPLMAAGQPKTLNGYIYGRANPVALADPTGLWVDEPGDGAYNRYLQRERERQQAAAGVSHPRGEDNDYVEDNDISVGDVLGTLGESLYGATNDITQMATCIPVVSWFAHCDGYIEAFLLPDQMLEPVVGLAAEQLGPWVLNQALDYENFGRMPDYVVLEATVGTAGTAGAYIVWTRGGDVFLAGEFGVGTPELDITIRAGWINQSETPTSSEVHDFVVGLGVTGSVNGGGMGSPAVAMTWSLPGGDDLQDYGSEYGLTVFSASPSASLTNNVSFQIVDGGFVWTE